MGRLVDLTAKTLIKVRDSTFLKKYGKILIWVLIIGLSLYRRSASKDLISLNNEMIASAMMTNTSFNNWIKIDNSKLSDNIYLVEILYLNQYKIPEIWSGTFDRTYHRFINEKIFSYEENNDNIVKRTYCLSAYENFNKFTLEIKPDLQWAFPDESIIFFCSSYSKD